MPLYQYAIASGHDQTNLDNIETVMTHAPIADRIPLGSVKRRTLDQRTHYNGTVTILWRWAAMSRADLNTLLSYMTGVDSGSAPVTICTPNYRDEYRVYNAYMTNPQPQSDWTRAAGGYGAVEPIAVEFVILEQLYGFLLQENGYELLLEDGSSLLLE